jgi:3beta-hydroxy-delta5-steroid dehydrogenase/steroid delta-isomerase
MAECLPYYVDLFHQMKGAAPEPTLAVTGGLPGDSDLFSLR